MQPTQRSDIVGLMRSAQQAEQQGRPADAEAAYRRILARHGDCDPAWHALGLLAHGAGNADMAVSCIERAVEANGKVALYHRDLGEMQRRLGRLDQALRSGVQACALAPDDLDAHYNLGLTYSDRGDHARAVDAYRAALAIDDRHGLSWNNLGSALEQLNDGDGAEQAYARAVALDPAHAEAHNNLGAIHSERGQMAAAVAHFEAAIAARPDFIEAHYNLSSFKRYRADDPHLATLEGLHARRAQMGEHARIRYCFALGKALDDIGQYDRAFDAYEEANRLVHRQLPMDEERAARELARVLAVFGADFFRARRPRRAGHDAGHTPIFIVGMPRSGTTLLEQILCSHPSVHGAGELDDLHRAIHDAGPGRDGQPFADGIALLDDEALRRIGDDYLRRVGLLSPASAFITDKMPANFFYLGLIHLALPHAKIIHAMRDPMDSCFSCYTRLFNNTMAFAYDQGTLGRYYARYMTLMRHWHAALPPGTILDLPYEALVADTEAQARRVLEFVGLPWDPRCLEFHRNERPVKTASAAQVRQPIYQSSVARWKHFAGHLATLHDIVKPWRAADDAALFARAAARPAAADAEHVEGIDLYRQGRFDEAQARYRRALALRPDFPQALNSLGFLLQDLGRLEEALACFARAVELAPQLGMARLNLGMLQLKIGEWEAGWDNYEARWSGSAEAASGAHQRPPCPLPQWDGQDGTAGQRLLVITEQGFGDTIQFARYLPLAARRFAKVGFVCSPPTQRLIEWAFGGEVLTLTRMPDDFQAWDWQCPLMSLPRAFGTRPDTVPAGGPYLRVPPPALAHWAERLDQAAGPLRVGIAWAGRKAHQCDARRSLHFGQLAPLFARPGVTWVSLQKWAPDETAPGIPADLDWIDWTAELTDFAATAALVANLDLVVSIDSSMAHLAGALGRPVWLMNRFDSEWRWFHGRADSPWYPSLRIFNQPAYGDWSGLLADVASALHALPAPRAPSPKRRRAPAAGTAVETRPSPHSLSAQEAYALAATLQSAGRLEDAERLLRQVLQVAPGHAHALHLLGVVAWSAGRPAQALELIGQALAIDGRTALFHSNLAEMLRQQGRVDKAVRHGETAIVLDPSLAVAHSNLGVAYYDAGDLARAETSQRRALELAPDLPLAYNNLGSIARARKDPAQAAGWYAKALALQPDHLEALSNLGAVLLENGQADDAAQPLERALQLQPRFAEALCNLGLVRFKQRRLDEAAGLLERSLSLRPHDPQARIGLASVHHEQQKRATPGYGADAA